MISIIISIRYVAIWLLCFILYYCCVALLHSLEGEQGFATVGVLIFAFCIMTSKEEEEQEEVKKEEEQEQVKKEEDQEEEQRQQRREEQRRQRREDRKEMYAEAVRVCGQRAADRLFEAWHESRKYGDRIMDAHKHKGYQEGQVEGWVKDFMQWVVPQVWVRLGWRADFSERSVSWHPVMSEFRGRHELEGNDETTWRRYRNLVVTEICQDGWNEFRQRIRAAAGKGSGRGQA